jgi:hypothetical protein
MHVYTHTTSPPLPYIEEEVIVGGRVYSELHRLVRRLESLFRDVQEVEFTVQDGE